MMALITEEFSVTCVPQDRPAFGVGGAYFECAIKNSDSATWKINGKHKVAGTIRPLLSAKQCCCLHADKRQMSNSAKFTLPNPYLEQQIGLQKNPGSHRPPRTCVACLKEMGSRQLSVRMTCWIDSLSFEN